MSSLAMKILVVDDNPGDQKLTLDALKEAGWTGDSVVAEDGDQALNFLQKAKREEGTPQLIILDLNLPGKDGKQVLAEIKEDPELKRIPVVILSSSASDRDITESYSLNANCYITKPIDLDDYYEMIRSLERFWLVMNRLPEAT